MYSQFITTKEAKAVMQHSEPLNAQLRRGAVMPSLLNFARDCAEGHQEEMVDQFREWVKTCECWHCAVLRTRIEISFQDLYLRHVSLTAYGCMDVMLS
jgi:hypothetical protein